MAIIKLQGEYEKQKGIYYEVDSTQPAIGEGGTGKVFEGKCVNSNTGETRPVAIKFMFANLSDQIIERARREASIQLRNDNLIEMLGFIETQENVNGKVAVRYHVVSELLHGVSLADVFQGKCEAPDGKEVAPAKQLLSDYQKDPDHFAKIIMKNVLSGLMALHDAGYIHRDIDPSNIMITDDGHIKLIDFGICKQMNNLTTHDKVQTVAGVFMGKPEYASPELVLGDTKHQDQTTDIYAMGIMMYQCVKGHVPFEGSRHNILDRQLKEKIPVKNIANPRIRRIIEKACEKRQELRYQTSAEMRVDIESLDIKHVMSPRKKRMIAITAIVTTLVVVGAIVGFSLFHTNAVDEQQQKSQTDSLVNVINTNLTEAKSLAQQGYLHDEEYDSLLVKAKIGFDKVDEAVAKLPAEEAKKIADYKADKDSLCSALKKAHEEFSQIVKDFEGNPDPTVIEAVNATNERIKKIENVIDVKK